MFRGFIRGLRRRLWRDRRRYALCAILLFFAGFVSFLDFNQSFMGIPFPVIAGLEFLFGIPPFAPLVCLIIPSWRFACEISAFTLLLSAIAGHYHYGFGVIAQIDGDRMSFFLSSSSPHRSWGSCMAATSWADSPDAAIRYTTG